MDAILIQRKSYCLRGAKIGGRGAWSAEDIELRQKAGGENSSLEVEGREGGEGGRG